MVDTDIITYTHTYTDSLHISHSFSYLCHSLSFILSMYYVCDISTSTYLTSTRQHEHPTGEHDTVGAVAVDNYGNVSYATSTGGITGKLCGRVGDSPIVGE